MSESQSLHMEDTRWQAGSFKDQPLARQLLDAMPGVVLALTPEGRVVYANRSTLELLGQEDQRAILGLRFGEVLGCVHAFETPGGCGTTEFCRTCGAERAILSSQNKPTTAEEWRVTRSQDEGVDASVFQVWVTPLEISGNQFTIFACVDISGERRRRALERIFFHDVLNTAGMLLATTALMLDEDKKTVEELKPKAYRLTKRLVGEIEAQRDLSEAERGELAIKPAAIRSLEFLRQIADMYAGRSVAEARGIRVAANTENITLISDPTLLERVIGNMVKNALEASRPGQTITMGCNVVGQQIEFWVHNEAVMSEEVQLQVFQRAFSTKGRGRGLGTYSMRLLSQRYLDGDVTFTSSNEKGTTFRARYPLGPPTGDRLV
jgi:signal transduction histidine kinase